MTAEIVTSKAANQMLADVANGLGFQVWHKFRGVEIRPDDLRLSLTMSGEDPSVIPDIDHESALKRAVREFRAVETAAMKDDQGNVVLTERAQVRAEIVSSNLSEITIGLLFHERVNGKKVRKVQNDTLVWDRSTKDFTNSGTTDFADRLIELANNRATYFDGNDVRRLIVKPALDRAGAFCIKDGIYFVPKAGKDVLAVTQEVLGRVEGFSLIAATLPSGCGWEAPLAEDARDSMNSDLDALHEQINHWEVMARRVSNSSAVTVMDRFTELHDRATAYEAALSVTLDDLRDRIDEMRTRAQDAIDAREQEADEREAARRKTSRTMTVEERATIQVEQMSDEDARSNLEALTGKKSKASIDTIRKNLIEQLVAFAALV